MLAPFAIITAQASIVLVYNFVKKVKVDTKWVAEFYFW